MFLVPLFLLLFQGQKKPTQNPRVEVMTDNTINGISVCKKIEMLTTCFKPK